MKTILLFSRCQLVDLYGSISQYLEKDFKVLHLAYSDEEFNTLQLKYGIKNAIHFKNAVSKLIQVATTDNSLVSELDNLIIFQSDGRFSLNASIQADRSFEFLNYDECIRLSVAYYKFWKQLIGDNAINYILHEPTSLFFNQIAALVAKSFAAKYLTQIQVYGEVGQNWAIVTGDDGKPEEIIKNQKKEITEEEKLRAKKFLETFRKDNSIFFGKYSKGNINIKRVLSASINSTGSYLKRRLNTIKIKNNLIDHVEQFTIKSFSLISEYKKQWGAYLNLAYDDFDPELQYYYYPVHCEPEAVVLYWGDSIYKNQVKLIENIAAQLPPNCFLYVKDHPHVGFYRDIIDYERIKAIPNVKLLNPSTPGKRVIRNSIGVITINGTSGFEAMLLGKQVYIFGNAFYSSFERVVRIFNIRNLREELYKNYNVDYTDDSTLINFVAAYLKSIHIGFTDYFINYTEIYNIDKAKNAEVVADGLKVYLKEN